MSEAETTDDAPGTIDDTIDPEEDRARDALDEKSSWFDRMKNNALKAAFGALTAIGGLGAATAFYMNTTQPSTPKTSPSTDSTKVSEEQPSFSGKGLPPNLTPELRGQLADYQRTVSSIGRLQENSVQLDEDGIWGTARTLLQQSTEEQVTDKAIDTVVDDVIAAHPVLREDEIFRDYSSEKAQDFTIPGNPNYIHQKANGEQIPANIGEEISAQVQEHLRNKAEDIYENMLENSSDKFSSWLKKRNFFKDYEVEATEDVEYAQKDLKGRVQDASEEEPEDTGPSSEADTLKQKIEDRLGQQDRSANTPKASKTGVEDTADAYREDIDKLSAIRPGNQIPDIPEPSVSPLYENTPDATPSDTTQFKTNPDTEPRTLKERTENALQTIQNAQKRLEETGDAETIARLKSIEQKLETYERRRTVDKDETNEDYLSTIAALDTVDAEYIADAVTNTDEPVSLPDFAERVKEYTNVGWDRVNPRVYEQEHDTGKQMTPEEASEALGTPAAGITWMRGVPMTNATASVMRESIGLEANTMQAYNVAGKKAPVVTGSFYERCFPKIIDKALRKADANGDGVISAEEGVDHYRKQLQEAAQSGDVKQVESIEAISENTSAPTDLQLTYPTGCKALYSNK